MLNTQAPDIFQCQIYHLDNGLRVVLSHDDDLPVLTSVMLYPVGLRQEETGKRGISHFIEHMLFKGTQAFGKGEIDRISLQCGGSNNAYTSLDATIYTINVPSEHCELVLQIEADRMCNPLFEPQEIEAEREVILEEWRTAEDDPDDAFWQKLSRLAMGQDAYGHPVLGYEQDIRQLSPQDLHGFFNTYYQPQLATLILVGKLPATIRELIQKHFGSIARGNEPTRIKAPIKTPPPTSQRYVEHREGVNTPRLVMCWSAPAFENKDYFAFLILQYILTEGWSSQLHALWVEEKQWASQVSSFIFESKAPYLFGVEVEILKSEQLSILEAELKADFNRIQIQPHELNKAKTQLITDLFLQQETTEQRAEFIADCLAAGSESTFKNYLAAIESVTVEDLTQLFKDYLTPDKHVTGWLLPTEVQL